MNEAYKGKYTGQQIDNLLDKVSLWLKGGDSENGATFYPYVDAEGNISWENDKNLANPPSVNIIGPQGIPGPKVSILDSYDSVEELYAAHPIGNLGDSYLVNGDLYVWFPNDTTWFNVGRIQGPEGPEGPKGPTGPAGPPGPSGEAPTVSLGTMLASGWTEDKVYSFEADYPSATYNVEIQPSEDCTIEQYEAWGYAMMLGNSATNTVKALGDVPLVDIPIIIKVVRK